MPADKLSEIISELYALDPADFIPARAGHIKQAKKDGDKDLAGEIGKLRKPTLVAWAVNIAARNLADELAGLLKLGDALRDAQRHLSGAALRTLTTQRQQVVGALAKRIADLAAELGHPLNESAVREVNQTLHAALADPDVTEKVTSGTLVAAASYSGFGPAGLSSVKDSAPPAPATNSDATAERERALSEAKAELDRQRRSTENARTSAKDARAKVDEIDARIAELRDELDRAEQERQFARSAERAADESRRRADRDLTEAERRVEDAQDALD